MVISVTKSGGGKAFQTYFKWKWILSVLVSQHISSHLPQINSIYILVPSLFPFPFSKKQNLPWLIEFPSLLLFLQQQRGQFSQKHCIAYSSKYARQTSSKRRRRREEIQKKTFFFFKVCWVINHPSVRLSYSLPGTNFSRWWFPGFCLPPPVPF